MSSPSPAPAANDEKWCARARDLLTMSKRKRERNIATSDAAAAAALAAMAKIRQLRPDYLKFKAKYDELVQKVEAAVASKAGSKQKDFDRKILALEKEMRHLVVHLRVANERYQAMPKPAPQPANGKGAAPAAAPPPATDPIRGAAAAPAETPLASNTKAMQRAARNVKSAQAEATKLVKERDELTRTNKSAEAQILVALRELRVAGADARLRQIEEIVAAAPGRRAELEPHRAAALAEKAVVELELSVAGLEAGLMATGGHPSQIEELGNKFEEAKRREAAAEAAAGRATPFTPPRERSAAVKALVQKRLDLVGQHNERFLEAYGEKMELNPSPQKLALLKDLEIKVDKAECDIRLAEIAEALKADPGSEAALAPHRAAVEATQARLVADLASSKQQPKLEENRQKIANGRIRLQAAQDTRAEAKRVAEGAPPLAPPPAPEEAAKKVRTLREQMGRDDEKLKALAKRESELKTTIAGGDRERAASEVRIREFEAKAKADRAAATQAAAVAAQDRVAKLTVALAAVKADAASAPPGPAGDAIRARAADAEAAVERAQKAEEDARAAQALGPRIGGNVLTAKALREEEFRKFQPLARTIPAPAAAAPAGPPLRAKPVLVDAAPSTQHRQRRKDRQKQEMRATGDKLHALPNAPGVNNDSLVRVLNAVRAMDPVPPNELKRLRTACVAWMKQAGPAIGSLDVAGQDAYRKAFADVKKVVCEARVEGVDQALAAREERRNTLDRAAVGIPKQEAPAVAAALESRQKEVREAKNGPKAAAALQATVDACEAFLQDPANDGKPVRAQVKEALAAADGDLKAIREINLALDKMSVKGDRWETDGVWSTADAGGIKIMKAGALQRNCKPGSEEPQVAAFLAAFRDEAERSDVFAEMARDLTSGDHFEGYPFAFGENSVGFYDSANDKAVDQSDLEYLPLKPSRVTMPDGSESSAGVVAGEVMLHVLEERLYMSSGVEYSPAHERCLDTGSFQNRYRRELGLTTDSILYDSCKHDECKNKKHNHGDSPRKKEEQPADFRPTTADGVVQVSPSIPQAKDVHPEWDVPRDATKVQYEQVDLNALLDTGWKDLLVDLRAQMIRTNPEKLEDECGKTLTHWKDVPSEAALEISRSLARKYHGDLDKADKIDAAKKALLQEVNRARREFVDERTTQWPAALDRRRSETDRAASAYERANAAKPAHDPDGFLVRRRRARAGGGPVNAANSTENCAMTAAGPILGKTSAEALAYYNSDVLAPALRNPAADLRENTKIWWKLQHNGREPGPEVTEQEIGDAQFAAQREMIQKEAQNRNQANQAGGHSLRYKTVQDGTPDTGQMYPKSELLQRMKQYPSGTEFQIFLSGASAPGVAGGNHWVYGSKMGSNLVIEDFQKNKTAGGGVAPRSGYVVGGDAAAEPGPGHATTDEPGFYQEGMFIAIVPMTDEYNTNAASGAILAPDTKGGKFPQLA